MPRSSIQSSSISPARTSAFEILSLVAAGKGNSDDLLHSIHTASLSPEDRNLVTALVLGTLRWQIALDARIQPLLQRPDQRLADQVALTLRLGAFQLLHLDRIPPHAAINESVEIARAYGHPHAAGMVNAILRKLAVEKPPSPPIYESAAALATRLAHPQWLVERWITQYGRAIATRICEVGQNEPSGPILFEDIPEADLPRIDDGSRLVAELTAASAPQVARLWDACAAPGGKTLVLAHHLSQAEVYATDISQRRLTAMEARFSHHAYATKVRTEVVDATRPPSSLGNFDLIFADVPCSGTGTLARNPEIRLRITPSDLTRHADRQRQILRATLSRLAPQGRLLYSTCSLEPEECEQVIEKVIAEQEFASSIRILPLAPVVDRLSAEGPLRQPLPEAVRGNYLRTLPGTHPGDGFFAALLGRID